MRPIEFKGQNVIIAKDQKEYLPLPAYKFEDHEGTLIFCMSVSKWEALKMLFTGRLWVQFLTFNQKVTPSYFTVTKKEVIVFAKPPNKIKMAFYNATKWCWRKFVAVDEDTVLIFFFTAFVTLVTVIYFLF
jgi:hypothetical protein